MKKNYEWLIKKMIVQVIEYQQYKLQSVDVILKETIMRLDV